MPARCTTVDCVGQRRVRISCVISAYNEADRIGQVLSVVLPHPLIDEVIVVDDGSNDGTHRAVAGCAGAILIRQDRNRGKSHAVAIGIEHAHSPILMLLDADLTGLTGADIRALAQPVIDGTADVTLSLRRNSLRIHKLLGVDFVSGERVFPKDLLFDHLRELRSLPNFGCEAFINKVIIESGCRVAVVRWPQVAHMRKQRKVGLWKGLLADILMLTEVGKVLTPKEILLQNYALALAAHRHRVQT